MMTDDPLAHARALYRAGAYAEAAAVLDNVRLNQPAQAAAQSMLGLCRLRLGDNEAALTLLRRAAEATPDDGEVLLNCGIGLMATNNPARAVPLFRRAADRLPFDPAPQLNLASALLMLGALSGANAAARKARLRAPNLAEAHYTVGLVQAAIGNLTVARRAFGRAVNLAPGFAEAWVNLGLARYRDADMPGARAAFERALAVQPENAAAHANLAVLDSMIGEDDAAAERLEAVLARDPANAEARLIKAVFSINDDRAADALAILEESPPAEPILRLHWRLQQAIALFRLDRIQEAAALLDSLGSVPAAFAPLLEFRRLVLALDSGDRNRACQHAEAMANLLRSTPGMLPEHTIASWSDLGRFWLRMREPGRAFDTWAEAHRGLRRFQPFSRDEYAAFQAAMIEAFDRTRLHEGARASNRDPAPVFVVGMPRSGTTLIEHILAAHRDVHGAGERSSLRQMFDRLGGWRETPAAVRRVAALGTQALDASAAAYLEELHALAPDKALVVDKMPGNFRLLGFLALLLPGARVIYCQRDPRDIGASIFRHRFTGYHPYAHDLADLGWYIAHMRQLMAHWQAVLPIPMLTLPMRDWVADFDDTLRRVLDFLDLPHDPACERFYEQEREVRTASRFQVRQPVNSRGIGVWHRFADRLGPLLAELEAGGVALESDDPLAPA